MCFAFYKTCLFIKSRTFNLPSNIDSSCNRFFWNSFQSVKLINFEESILLLLLMRVEYSSPLMRRKTAHLFFLALSLDIDLYNKHYRQRKQQEEEEEKEKRYYCSQPFREIYTYGKKAKGQERKTDRWITHFCKWSMYKKSFPLHIVYQMTSEQKRINILSSRRQDLPFLFSLDRIRCTYA